jgi:hypothetical protein
MSRAAAAVAVKLQCASENMALASSVIADTLRKGRRSGAAPAGDIFTKGSTLLNNVMAKVRLCCILASLRTLPFVCIPSPHHGLFGPDHTGGISRSVWECLDVFAHYSLHIAAPLHSLCWVVPRERERERERERYPAGIDGVL